MGHSTGPRACALCPRNWGVTGIPVWPGTGRAQHEEEDDVDFGLDGYDDDDEEEEEEASVTAGGRGRGDRSPPPEDAGTHPSFATLCVGSVECQAR